MTFEGPMHINSNDSVAGGLNRSWNILNWNIRGINSDDKCNAIKEKIDESSCDVFCVQETKRDHFDHSFIRKLASKCFNKYAFSPSDGASGGIVMGWNSSVFKGEVVQINKFSITVNFSSTHNGQILTLTTVHGPCQGPDRDEFVQWLNNLHFVEDDNWMIMGDFNFYRSLSDRNRGGAT